MSIDYKKLAEEFPRSDWEWRAEQCGITNNKAWVDVKQLTDHNLSSHHMDMYLDEAKHNIETAIYYRALQKKAYERLEGERI